MMTIFSHHLRYAKYLKFVSSTSLLAVDAPFFNGGGTGSIVVSSSFGLNQLAASAKASNYMKFECGVESGLSMPCHPEATLTATRGSTKEGSNVKQNEVLDNLQ